MRDPLRTKLNLIITAVVAFAIGLGIAARFDLTPPGVAQEKNPPLRLVSSNSDASAAQAIPMNGFAEIAEQITPAVVTIYVDRDIPEHSQRRLPEPFDQFQPEVPPTVAAVPDSSSVRMDTSSRTTTSSRTRRVSQ